ncbi:MAG: L-threonylcarbamoyladenylate synthase, partial [Verrucomicrobiae bacterium]|nr:L-threonylcarbamoyladenylate synthase [Verrucomicrobiae bacterium]
HSHGAVLTETFHRLADVFWPGPLTMVLRHESQGDMAYRIPDHAVARQLIEASGEPLLVTSANLSGQPDSGEAWEAARSLGGSVAMVLDAGPCRHMVPSTVVSLLEPKLTLLREGAIREAELLAVLR